MWYLRYLFVVLGGFSMNVPVQSHAAENPVLLSLAQGTIVQFSGKEAISQPFDFDVTVATNDKNLNLTLAIGQPIAITIAPGRVVSGMVERIEQVDGPGVQGHYRLQILPSASRLKYRTTSRTFYGKNATEITTQLLSEAGVGNVEMRVAAPLPAEEMTVQYQESDFEFVSRLLEAAGIHYHVEAIPGGEKFVLGDGNAAFPASPLGKVAFSTGGSPAIFSFSRGQSLHTGQVQAGDYNWKAPGTDLSATAQATVFQDLTERVFPAGTASKPESQRTANLRLALRIAEAQACAGESTYPQLQAGTRVLLTGHPRADFNQEYLITSVEHQKTTKEYRNTFRCLPSQVVFRPHPSTPTPVIPGVVSGIVVGPPGETKHVDQFGRIKVRFPWRSPAHSIPNDPGDAGFVRIAQLAAGAGNAAMWLPDVGDEVLVAFEHGDPNRPVVVGSVYNAKDMPPVALPANKHLSILRSQSASGGSTELVYDTTPGNERLLIQSGPNGLTLAAGGITLHGPSVSISATGDLVQRAGRTLVQEAGADLSVKSGQHLSVTSQKDALVSIAGNTQISIGSNLQATVGGTTVVDSGKDLSVRTGQNLLLQTARTARFTAGEDVAIQTGRSLLTQSGAMFQFVAAQTGMIQVGDALVGLKKDGTVDIVGKDIAVTASGNLAMKSSKDLILKGSKITQN